MTNEEAIKRLKQEYEGWENYHFVYEGINTYIEALKLAVNALEEERPQGEWIWLGDNPNPNHKWSCSKCGRGVKEQENFCPNCGADMRKGGKE